MTPAELLSGTEATALLGYKNRSSLTRLVQAGRISPAFTASGERGEQFFNRADIEALQSSPAVVVPDTAAAGASEEVAS